MNTMRLSISKYFVLLFCLNLVIITGCNDDDNGEPPYNHTGLGNNSILIKDIQGVPGNVVFDHVAANISGKFWETIATVEGTFDGSQIILELPTTFAPDLLHPSQTVKGQTGLGFWPTVSSDPQAGVAGLADIIAYNETEAVGRVYLTNWSGKGSNSNEAYIYYQYAEKEFSLSGSIKNFTYSATFKPGWNAYANIKYSKGEGENGAHCTTDIPETLGLQWRFEAW